MRSLFIRTMLLAGIVTACFVSQGQELAVSVVNTGSNVMQIVGEATSPGFTAGSPSTNKWSTMNLTWRIPKSAAVPAPTVSTPPPPGPTPEVSGESTGFTGATPVDAVHGGVDLTMFDLTMYGEPDDGYWYFQVVGSTEQEQSIATGSSVVLYSFTVPSGWSCPGCVELLTSDVPALLAHGISTTSYIDNATMSMSDMDVLTIAQNNAPLPVEFVSFEARRRGDQAALTWKTTREQNVKGYSVERSSNGSSYHPVGYVAALEPAALNIYTFTDAVPLKGTNYYRIREEDLDGKVQYSEIRVVTFEGTGALAAFVYPVPVSSKLKVDIQAQVSEPATLRITDMHGRRVLQQSVQLRVEGNLETIGVSQLKPGLYVIELVGSTVRWTGKFIKE